MSSVFKSVYMTDEVLKTVSWSAVAPSATNQTPVTDTEITLPYDTRSAAVQVDMTATANESTDVDINVHASIDGSNWDTTPYNQEFASIGDAAVKTILLTPGVGKIRLRLDNNDSTNSAHATVRVLLRGE